MFNYIVLCIITKYSDGIKFNRRYELYQVYKPKPYFDFNKPSWFGIKEFANMRKQTQSLIDEILKSTFKNN